MDSVFLSKLVEKSHQSFAQDTQMDLCLVLSPNFKKGTPSCLTFLLSSDFLVSLSIEFS